MEPDAGSSAWGISRMHTSSTAIIHLREPVVPRVRRAIRRLITVVRGVEHVHFKPRESMIAVRYDSEQAGLAEIVRMIEDSGTAVSGVAQRG